MPAGLMEKGSGGFPGQNHRYPTGFPGGNQGSLFRQVNTSRIRASRGRERSKEGIKRPTTYPEIPEAVPAGFHGTDPNQKVGPAVDPLQ